MSSCVKYALFLAAGGDSIDVVTTTAKPEDLIPEELNTSAYKTHERVLAFLMSMRDSEFRDSLRYYHMNNEQHSKHYSALGTAHPCTLDDQIEYVREVIQKIKNSKAIEQLPEPQEPIPAENGYWLFSWCSIQ